jgi:tetratricopeptide (TPR) repeat protein
MHERQMEAVQSSNRTILLAAGVFAAVGLVGLIFISLILVRAIGRFSELAVVHSQRPMLGQGTAMTVPALGPGESVGGRGAAEQAAGRFQGALEQLQRRIQELEHELHTPPPSLLPPEPSVQPAARPRLPLPAELPPHGVANIQTFRPAVDAAPPSRASVLLGKGQALLSLDAPEQALTCFEEALNLDPGNADILVKRGMAFEKLEDWDQALDSYNRAIAADSTLTVAYLYRGGVCNRLQRYREALESYEDALRTEKKSRAS